MPGLPFIRLCRSGSPPAPIAVETWADGVDLDKKGASLLARWVQIPVCETPETSVAKLRDSDGVISRRARLIT